MKRTIVILLGTMALLTGCSRTARIQNVNDVPIHSPTNNLTHAEVQSRILSAVARRHWVCHSISPNTLRCTHEVRTHSATVDIIYSPYSYSINHVRTSGLRERGQLIHKKYNKWIHLMKEDIEKELGLPSTP